MNCGNEMKMKKRRFCYINCPLKSESLRVAYEFSHYLLIFLLQFRAKCSDGSGGIRTHASEETGALNQRLRPLGHATICTHALVKSYLFSNLNNA